MNDLKAKLDYADAVAESILEMGETRIRLGDLEDGLKYTYVAAYILSRQNRTLSSPRIESNLRFIASRLPVENDRPPVVPREPLVKEVCLHVLSEALPAGGHTAMAIRWIRNDSANRIHSVALLAQEIPIPVELLEAVAGSGGTVYKANSDDSFVSRAVWLRNLSNSIATYVILHIDVCDVICGAAYGITGGPPVLLVNHGAQVFWTGVSIADLVANCRGSSLEVYWTTTYRGSPRCATIPIPLLERKSPLGSTTSNLESRNQAKELIGIPADAIVLLTVGASFKYLPANGLDFLEVCESILKQLPKVFLFVAGFDADSRWRKASQRLAGRIRVLGLVKHSELAMIHEATDIYIEGFPFGTTTSLLEAAHKGIPVVLAPAQCPPPYGSDGVQLDGTLVRPRSVEEYKTTIVQLSNSEAERSIQGAKVFKTVTAHNIGSGWKQHLEDAINKLPREHSIYPYTKPVRTPEADHEYWSTLIEKASSGYEETLEIAFIRALGLNLRLPLHATLQQICKNYRSVRRRRTVPMPLLVLLHNFNSLGLPIVWVRHMFQLCSFLCRASLCQRALRKVPRLLGRVARSEGYEAYRKMRGCPAFGDVKSVATSLRKKM